MYYFYGKNMENVRLLEEATGETPPSLLPKFYSGSWDFNIVTREDKEHGVGVHEDYPYDYILFCGDENLESRIALYKTEYPNMELVKKCYPSFVDSFLKWLNPRNRNEYIEIWKTNLIH